MDVLAGTSITKVRVEPTRRADVEQMWNATREFMMQRDAFDIAIDRLLAAADGDVRRALRALLQRNVLLQLELHDSNGVSRSSEEEMKATLR